MFSTISAIQVDDTLTPLFTNPNISLFPNDIFAYDSSSSLTQPATFPDESPPPMEPVDSSFVIPSSSIISPPPPLHHTSRVSQPSIFLRDYVWNSTTVSYEPHTYYEASSNPLW